MISKTIICEIAERLRHPRGTRFARRYDLARQRSARRLLVEKARQFRVAWNRERVVARENNEHTRKRTVERGERTGTGQNRTTVNGSSLQSSYFLTMVGQATYVRTQGTRRIESPRERTAESNRKTVLFLIARPPCSALSFALRHGAPFRPIETAERLRTRD